MERSLRIATGDRQCIFETLLESSDEQTAYQGNLQVLMAEFYKIVNGHTHTLQ